MWELDYKESWAPKNWSFWTVVLKTLESPLDCKEIQLVHSKGNQSWIFTGRTYAEAETLATWCEELTHLKRPWCWERLKAGGEGGDRGWDGWMAWPTQQTWVRVDSGSWWWTGRPGVLRFMGSQRVGHDWATELNWTEVREKWWMWMMSFNTSSLWGSCYYWPQFTEEETGSGGSATWTVSASPLYPPKQPHLPYSAQGLILQRCSIYICWVKKIQIRSWIK